MNILRIAPLLFCSLFLGACATAPKPVPPTVLPPAPVAPAVIVPPVVHEGPNYRYVEREIAGVDADQVPPFWLTSFNNSGRLPVLPINNQGVALVLQAPVGVPKILVEEQSSASDRVHIRIVNRGNAGLQLDITCLNRTPPNRRHAAVQLSIGGRSMIDLALDTPSGDRDNLMLRVR